MKQAVAPGGGAVDAEAFFPEAFGDVSGGAVVILDEQDFLAQRFISDRQES